MKYISFFIFCLLYSIAHLSYANQCSFSSFTSSQMVLLPIRGDSSNVAFTVNCDRDYMISFFSENGHTSDGISFLRNDQNTVKTLLSVTGSNRIPWATSVLQKTNSQNHYVINVRVIDSISPTLKSGTYRDQIHVMIEY